MVENINSISFKWHIEDNEHYLRRLLTLMRLNYNYTDLRVLVNDQPLDTSKPFEYCNCAYCSFDILNASFEELFDRFHSVLSQDLQETLRSIDEHLSNKKVSSHVSHS